MSVIVPSLLDRRRRSRRTVVGDANVVGRGLEELLDPPRFSARLLRILLSPLSNMTLDWVHQKLSIALTIVKRTDDVKGFQVIPRRWVVERTLAWITRHRRCARDYERLPAHHETMNRWSQIRLTSKRLAKKRF